HTRCLSDWSSDVCSSDLSRMVRALDGSPTLLVINDRVDVARVVHAHGVHLGKSDLPVAEARTLLGAKALLGGTAHNVAEALEVEIGRASCRERGEVGVVE